MNMSDMAVKNRRVAHAVSEEQKLRKILEQLKAELEHVKLAFKEERYADLFQEIRLMLRQIDDVKPKLSYTKRQKLTPYIETVHKLYEQVRVTAEDVDEKTKAVISDIDSLLDKLGVENKAAEEEKEEVDVKEEQEEEQPLDQDMKVVKPPKPPKKEKVDKEGDADGYYDSEGNLISWIGDKAPEGPDPCGCGAEKKPDCSKYVKRRARDDLEPEYDSEGNLIGFNSNNDGVGGNGKGKDVHGGTPSAPTDKEKTTPPDTNNADTGNNSSRVTDYDRAINRYAELLVAKEKLVRDVHDKAVLADETNIIQEFADAVRDYARNSSVSEEDAIKTFMTEVSRRMTNIRPGENFLYRAGHFMRKLPVSLLLTAMAAGSLILMPIAPTLAGTLLVTAIAGRSLAIYTGINSLMSFLHETIRKRFGKKVDRKVGASVIYGDELSISKNIDQYSKTATNLVRDLSNEVAEYATKFRRFKIIRHITSALAALTYAGYEIYTHWTKIFGGPDEVKRPPVVVTPPKPGLDVTAHPGEGIWHISERALKYYYGDAFTNLDQKQKIAIIDALKRNILAHLKESGLNANEIIPRALNKGGPWLKLNATIDALKDPNFVKDALGDKYLSLLKGAGEKVAHAATQAALKVH